MTEAVTFETRTLQRLSVGLLGLGAIYAISPVHPPIPCPLRSLTGIPCPLCGATRAVTALARGDIATSLRFNPIGIVLVAIALALLITRPKRQLSVAPWLLIGAFVSLWVWNIGFNPTFT